MTSPGEPNQHCANCVGTLSFPMWLDNGGADFTKLSLLCVICVTVVQLHQAHLTSTAGLLVYSLLST